MSNIDIGIRDASFKKQRLVLFDGLEEVVVDRSSSIVPDLSLDTLWELLAESRFGILATIKRDGRPQLSNVGYQFDPETRVARIVAASFRAKTRNLERDPRASLHVSNDNFKLWLVAEGSAELSAPARSIDDAVGSEIISMSEREHRVLTTEEQSEHLTRYPVIDRQIIRLHVERIYGGNASKALGVSSS